MGMEAISSYVQPSRRRPLRFLKTQPYCFKWKATLAQPEPFVTNAAREGHRKLHQVINLVISALSDAPDGEAVGGNGIAL